MKKKFAFVISRACEPMVILSILAFLAGLHAGLTDGTFMLYLMVVFIVMVVPPVYYRLKLLAAHQTDWDVTDRKKRIKPLVLQSVFLLLDILLIALFGNSVLTHTYLLLFIWLLGFLGITTQWKISGHTATTALVTGFAVHWFGWAWWPLLLTVPILGWARVVRRDHTVAQVIAGATYSWTLLYISTVAGLL